MVSQLTVIDAAFLSRSRGGGVTRKIHEERGEKIKQVEKQMPDPLSAKETQQQQIAALRRQIYP